MNTRTGLILALLALGLCCAIGPAMADMNSTVQQGMSFINNSQTYTGPVVPAMVDENGTVHQGTPYTNDIQPYTGPMGPDSSLYGLKLAFENLDESFTFNQTERLEKEIQYDNLRIAELEAALAASQSDAANRAMDQYWLDLNRTEQTMSWYNATGSQYAGNLTGFGNSSYQVHFRNPVGTGSLGGLEHSNPPQPPSDAAMIAAQQQIALHQDILQRLLDTHPDNKGLARVCTLSLDLEKKFEDRTLVHFELQRDTAGHITFHPVILNPVIRDHTPLTNAWNQTRTIPVHSGNGQITGWATQAWQDQHHQDNASVNYTHVQYPVNNPPSQYGNTTFTRNDDWSTHGNNDQNGSRNW